MEALPQSSILDPQSSISWLLAQQNRVEHPYTHAAPGGWAWTDLPGGVPDADDTAGALLALAKLRGAGCGARNEEITRAAEAGIRWLLDLQNSDGGIPTFCRGWGALPFDRSSPDITAHALRAWTEWRHNVDGALDRRMRLGRLRAIRFLEKAQQSDGSWIPLWFGNQHAPHEENRIYGTARVVKALANYGESTNAFARAITFLVSSQHRGGSWGSANEGSVEETALAVEALADVMHAGSTVEVKGSVARGVNWLMNRIESGEWREPSPIGFYFAKLWYFETLYPMIFAVGALRAISELPSTPDL